MQISKRGFRPKGCRLTDTNWHGWLVKEDDGTYFTVRFSSFGDPQHILTEEDIALLNLFFNFDRDGKHLEIVFDDGVI